MRANFGFGFLPFVCLLSVTGTQALAEVSVSSFDKDGSMAMGTLKGQISVTDAAQLRRLLPASRAAEGGMARVLSLESPGGDWNAAMSIGRLLRNSDVVVMVGKEGCHSACVLLLAGAPRRLVFGPIGIHRPYPADVQSRSYADAQERYRVVQTTTRLYLEEMNLPSSLFDAMARIPPESLKVLSQQELADFGLTGVDPVTQDLQDAEEARRYGLDRRTFLERTVRRDALCPDLAASFKNDVSGAAQVLVDCRREVMQGIR
jgi:hypothetical protein